MRNTINALSWFNEPERMPIYEAFASRFLSHTRVLYLELALSQVIQVPKRILEIGCGKGDLIDELLNRYNHVDIVGLEPAANNYTYEANISRFVQKADIKSASLSGEFDLILSYSNFRFWSDPKAELESLGNRLSTNGFAFILDLKGQLSEEMQKQMIDSVKPFGFADFLEDQMVSAYSSKQVQEMCSAIGPFHGHRSKYVSNGILGYSPFAPEIIRLMQSNQNFYRAIEQAQKHAIKVDRGWESVHGILILPTEEISHV